MSSRRPATRHERREEAREKARSQARRGLPPMLPVAAAVLVVAAIVILFIVFRPGKPTPSPSPQASAAIQQVIAEVTSIPASRLDQVGAGRSSNKLKAMSESPLTSGGKPEILYIGAEYCPFCAAERWPLIIALSRFGTFSGLQATTSSSSDVFADTATFTFRHASYRSDTISFVALELTDREQNVLQQPTAAQQALLQKYNAGIPFVDFGNRMYFAGATYDQTPISGLDWAKIAASLQDPSSPSAQGILGSANLITAAICAATGDQPSAACGGPVIQGIERQLPHR